MAQVILENIYKSYSKSATNTGSPPQDPQTAGNTILRRINLTIQDSEFMVLVGPSGCGKSTLLRLIAGLEAITAGNIWVGERLINDLPPKDRDIAMVFQNYALYPHLNVYDNIAFGLRRTQPINNTGNPYQNQLQKTLVSLTRKLPKKLRYFSETEKQIYQQVHSVAQLLQIETLLDRLPKQLSGGQKQRVALGRAIARNPQVFLMDEPLSNLDAKLRTETRAQIVKLQRQLGTTTIYVTHDQIEAMTMGDRIAVMNGGQIQQVAPPLEIYNRPTNLFVAQFIGSPPMNFVAVEVKAPLQIIHPQFRLTLPEVWAKTLQPYDGQMLTLGIRPEHLNIAVPAIKNLPVQIELVEALGSETLLHVSLTEGGQNNILQVRIEPDRSFRAGEQLWLGIIPEKIHLFDPQTGLALFP